MQNLSEESKIAINLLSAQITAVENETKLLSDRIELSSRDIKVHVAKMLSNFEPKVSISLNKEMQNSRKKSLIYARVQSPELEANVRCAGSYSVSIRMNIPVLSYLL